ncbi:unnamed protein product [Rotaria socialis]|uniref:Homeobox domain-containing protein n=1 Tax=Rotaria socialis TaxID=392032 RepID=A0A818GS67_9BILA|nr:unnamed protein product [Rotaria socialis]
MVQSRATASAKEKLQTNKALADASSRIIDEHAHRRRRRYVFSQSQLAHLETEFGYNHFIPTMRLQQLAYELSIDKLTLRSWFSRRRHRERRNRQIQPVPPVMNYFGAPYPFQAIAD